MVSEHAAHGRSPETIDRVFVGGCGAIWLALVGISAVAILALIDLGRGHAPEGGSGSSSWLLYTIIGVSALILIAAVPLLLRARRAGAAQAAEVESEEVAEAIAPVRPTEAKTEKLRVFGTSVDPYDKPLPETPRAPSRLDPAVLNRLWLRGTTALLSATGVALIGVAVGTYLLAVSSATGAWVALGFAAVVTVAMPAVLVAFQRQLGEAVEEASA